MHNAAHIFYTNQIICIYSIYILLHLHLHRFNHIHTCDPVHLITYASYAFKIYIYVYNYIYNKLKQSMTFNAQAIHLRFRFWRFARHRRIRCGQTLWEAREKNDEKGMGDTLEMKMLIIQKHGDKWRRMEFSEELCSFLGWVWISQWWVLPSKKGI